MSWYKNHIFAREIYFSQPILFLRQEVLIIFKRQKSQMVISILVL